MKRLALVLVAFAGVAACHASNSLSGTDVFGSWKVTKLNTTGEITESEQQMTALVGTTLILSANKVLEAGEDPCPVQKPYPTIAWVNTADEVSIKSAPSPAAAGLPQRAVMVDFGCIAVFKVGNHLVFGDRGAWYTAQRVHRPTLQ